MLLLIGSWYQSISRAPIPLHLRATHRAFEFLQQKKKKKKKKNCQIPSSVGELHNQTPPPPRQGMKKLSNSPPLGTPVLLEYIS